MYPVSPLCVIQVRGLEGYAHHGVPDEEQTVGHRYRIDADLHLPSCPAADTDDVAGTVDYGAVCAELLTVLHGERRRTVERLARLMADRLLARFPTVTMIEITVEKPFPPAPVIAASLGVRLMLERISEPGGA